MTHHRFAPGVFAGAFATVFAATPAAGAKPETRVRAEIPAQYRWDFSDIYPSWEAWEAACDPSAWVAASAIGRKLRE